MKFSISTIWSSHRSTAKTPLAAVDRLDSGAVVGRVAKADLPAGTLITPSMFAPEDALAPGEGVVGLALSAGQVPSLSLPPGQQVSVILTPRAGTDLDLTDGGAATTAEQLVARAVVVESQPLGSSDRTFVSLSMTEADAQTVAVAASLDRVRLIAVAGDVEP